MAYDSAELYHKCGGGEVVKGWRWRERERGEGRKEAWESVFIFLITYRPCGIAGMNECGDKTGTCAFIA